MHVPMMINTTRFGPFTVEDEDVLHFPKGIPGFEGHTRWALAGEDDNPVKWLQSLTDGDVALPVVTPHTFFPEYRIQLERADLAFLKCETPDALAMLVVVAIPSDRPWDASANLRAPIVVNTELRVARQIILDDEDLSLQTPILPPELREKMMRTAPAASPEAAEGSD